ncbi:MAG TPA: DUF1822 family protein [Coleofasciculaceae cyanobacterium]
MTLLFDSSTPYLEIPDEVDLAAWQQQAALDQAALGNRWQAYLNQLCFQTVLPWLQEKYGSDVGTGPPLACPELWELVNGSAIMLGTTRLVLIPTDASDRQEFRVPQEWIDLPTWAGDYYLAIEVDPDDRWVTIWGYTTHDLLKTQGSYDAGDRAYCLEPHDLIADLNVLWVMHRLATEPTRVAIPALPALSSAQSDRLLLQLGDAAVVLPRLEVPFAEWGALIEPQERLQQLYHRRHLASASSAESLAQVPANLSRWLQNAFETGWLAIEDLLNSNQTPEFAFSLRHDDSSAPIVRRVKSIQLTETVSVLLLVLLEPESDGRIGVRVRVLPEPGTANLPEHFSLSLLAMSGEVLQSVQARRQDNSIQLRRFRCPVGMPFRLQVAIADTVKSEDFVS